MRSVNGASRCRGITIHSIKHKNALGRTRTDKTKQDSQPTLRTQSSRRRSL